MTVARQPVLHTLRHNKLERSPHRLLVIDSESKVCPDAWGDVEGYNLLGADRFAQPGLQTPAELQVLRCWSACLVRRHDHEPKKPRREWYEGESADELASIVQRLTSHKATTWLFAHNLSYDLALTGLTLALLRAGWTLGRHNLASDAPWAFLKRRSKALRLADSWSWLPLPVAQLGELTGLDKLPLPQGEAPADEWRARCRRDVAITMQALLRLLDTWDAQRLGSWSITGPASAWNTMLHRAPGQSVVIDPDPDARRFERTACYSGRRDLTKVGTLSHGPYVLLDLREAYAAVCACKLLPVWRAPATLFDAVESYVQNIDLSSIIAECIVQTDAPRYPARLGHTIVHPVGTFRTVLAGPELEDARRRDALRWLGGGYRYRLGVRMQPWAQWVLQQLRDDTGRADPILQTFLKQASRTVPGRWGMLIQREGESIRSWRDDWYLEPAVFGEAFAPGAWLHLNGTATQLIRDQDGDDAFPAVLAFVQAWVRVQLQALLDELGEGRWLQVNTDGAWVRETDSWVVDEYNRRHWPFALRIKATRDALELRTPQHWRTERERAYAGVPRSATELTPNVFQFQTWPKLAGQMRRGDPRGYVRELRTVDLSDAKVARWVAEDGCTAPPALTYDAQRGNVLLGPNPFGCEAHGTPWRLEQHHALAG